MYALSTITWNKKVKLEETKVRKTRSISKPFPMDPTNDNEALSQDSGESKTKIK